MRFHRYLLVLVLGLLAGVVRVDAQDDTPFALYSSTPVVRHGEFNAWDGRFTDPGAVVYHEGVFHMFRNGFRAWPASVEIGYLTSSDGVAWTEVSEDPILYSADVPLTDLAALASSALVEADGTWVLYFYTWNSSTAPAAEIGRATAPSPLGPWMVDPEPMLTHGGPGSWDSAHVDAPSVVRTADGYLMYYAGSTDVPRSAQIGLATSPDGVHWTKYDDPTTTEAPFAESDPVLVADRSDVRFHQPRVERVGAGYVMIYRMMPMSGSEMGLGIATSQDGIHWENQTEDSVWGRGSIPGGSGFWYTATATDAERLYLYIEGGRSGGTDIYLATADLEALMP